VRDLLRLDEPNDPLDAESVAWLERFLKDSLGTVIASTRDRCFFDNVAERILELSHDGDSPFRRSDSSWLEQKRARLEIDETRGFARRGTIDRELSARERA
jgi:ATPase subunit of ABC transporter with duplicated ATPase domains